MSVHDFADASQKLTCPDLTGAPPAVTVALKVTTAPSATVVTGLFAEVNVSAVVVLASGGGTISGVVAETLELKAPVP
jgi:hypothetical protein